MTMMDKMQKINTNPEAVKMADILLENGNLTFSEVIDMVFRKYFC